MHISGQLAGKGAGLSCHNKDQAPHTTPAICPWYANILPVEVAGVFGTRLKNIADSWASALKLPVYQQESGNLCSVMLLLILWECMCLQAKGNIFVFSFSGSLRSNLHMLQASVPKSDRFPGSGRLKHWNWQCFGPISLEQSLERRALLLSCLFLCTDILLFLFWHR